MEIGGVSSPSYAHPQVLEPRAAKPAVREVAAANAAGNTKVSADASDTRPDRAALARLQASRTDPENEKPREESEARPAHEATATGHIQFEYEERTRVMKLYDSKDVLIYQIPPKGVLALVKAAEDDADSRLQTSA